MESLKIIGINRTSEGFFIPHVEFNSETGLCEIAGGSYLENTFEFYQKLEDWIEEYLQLSIDNELVINIKLKYFNTSSGKGISSILHNLKIHQDNGRHVRINWFYHDDDIDSVEEAEDFIKATKAAINLIEVDSKISM